MAMRSSQPSVHEQLFLASDWKRSLMGNADERSKINSWCSERDAIELCKSGKLGMTNVSACRLRKALLATSVFGITYLFLMMRIKKKSIRSQSETTTPRWGKIWLRDYLYDQQQVFTPKIKSVLTPADLSGKKFGYGKCHRIQYGQTNVDHYAVSTGIVYRTSKES